MGDNKDKWTDDIKYDVWNKAHFFPGHDVNEYRKDMVGAKIKYEDHGKRDSSLGWEIDHIVPESFLQKHGVPQDLIDDLENLQPLHYENNINKSDDFPFFYGILETIGSINFILKTPKRYKISLDIIEKLRALYSDYVDINTLIAENIKKFNQ